MYLSIIKDLFNGEIVAYTIEMNQDTKLVLDTLNQLPKLPKGFILHSEQGSVNTFYAYQKAVKEITMNLSRKVRQLIIPQSTRSIPC